MRVAVGSDHAGFGYKQLILDHLKTLGHECADFGTHSEESVDYPDFIVPVARAVAAGEFDRGIVLGGSGNGEAIAANKVRGIRCGLCWNDTTAELCRRHNDSNMLSLGQRMITAEQALSIVDIWLETPFDGGRHTPRIQKVDAIEP
ncbi:MAG: ribose 5-phosphate isomerase B [Planctomycetota bacterium]|nr:ribose 5-phosphate isomerase B [Planctomycetaceae bacterium]MDQ3330818.1 ribose 5-phosphate isomerase B [Planctomycetota bacterium]